MHGKWNQIARQMTLSLNGANNLCHVTYNEPIKEQGFI